MKINTSNKDLTTVSIGELEDDFVGIDAKSTAFIIKATSKNLYGDIYGSIVREITSNCYDAHIDNDTPDAPIFIEFTRDLENNEYIMSFEDQGKGMSVDIMKKVYSKWFASTKRKTDKQIGGWGLGSKSILGYKHIDNFDIITTCDDGVTREYNLYETETSPKYVLLNEYQSNPEEKKGTGTIIKFNVARQDLSYFQEAIKNQLAYFNTVVVIDPFLKTYDTPEYDNNFKIIDTPVFKWRPDTSLRHIHACVNNVVYKIDFNQLDTIQLNMLFGHRVTNIYGYGNRSGERNTWNRPGYSSNNTNYGSDNIPSENLQLNQIKLPVGLKLDISDVDVTLSREVLDYTEKTKKSLIKKLYSLFLYLEYKNSNDYNEYETIYDIKRYNSSNIVKYTDNYILESNYLDYKRTYKDFDIEVDLNNLNGVIKKVIKFKNKHNQTKLISFIADADYHYINDDNDDNNDNIPLNHSYYKSLKILTLKKTLTYNDYKYIKRSLKFDTIAEAIWFYKDFIYTPIVTNTRPVQSIPEEYLLKVRTDALNAKKAKQANALAKRRATIAANKNKQVEFKCNTIDKYQVIFDIPKLKKVQYIVWADYKENRKQVCYSHGHPENYGVNYGGYYTDISRWEEYSRFFSNSSMVNNGIILFLYVGKTERKKIQKYCPHIKFINRIDILSIKPLRNYIQQQIIFNNELITDVTDSNRNNKVLTEYILLYDRIKHISKFHTKIIKNIKDLSERSNVHKRAYCINNILKDMVERKMGIELHATSLLNKQRVKDYINGNMSTYIKDLIGLKRLNRINTNMLKKINAYKKYQKVYKEFSSTQTPIGTYNLTIPINHMYAKYIGMSKVDAIPYWIKKTSKSKILSNNKYLEMWHLKNYAHNNHNLNTEYTDTLIVKHQYDPQL